MANGAALAIGAPAGTVATPGGTVAVTQENWTPPNTPPGGAQGQGPPAYIATHYTEQLPSAQGDVAKALEAASDAAAQRTLASTLRQFLDNETSDLRDLNGDVAQFTALILVLVQLQSVKSHHWQIDY